MTGSSSDLRKFEQEFGGVACLLMPRERHVCCIELPLIRYEDENVDEGKKRIGSMSVVLECKRFRMLLSFEWLLKLTKLAVSCQSLLPLFS